MVIEILFCFVFLIITCIKTQRVTIISSPLTDNYIDWQLVGGTSSGIVDNFRCPEPTCFRIYPDDHLYRYVNTTGYNNIQIGYDIITRGLDTAESCIFSWVIGAYLPSEGSWTIQEKHTTDSILSILHSSLPNNLDNTASVGIDFLSDVSDRNEYCLINNVLITGIPITQHPSLVPTHDPTVITVSPTNNPSLVPSLASPTNNPSRIPSINPTLAPSFYPSKPPTLAPTFHPSKPPTMTPTRQPTNDPSSINPSATPSFNPVNSLNPSTNPVQTDTTQSVITTDYDEVKRKDGYMETEEHNEQGQAGQAVGAAEILNSVLIVMAIIICCMCGCFLYLTFRYQEKKGMVDAHIAISEARLAMGSIADDDRPNAMQQKANPNAAAPAADPMQNNNAFGAMYGGMAASDSMWR